MSNEYVRFLGQKKLSKSSEYTVVIGFSSDRLGFYTEI